MNISTKLKKMKLAEIKPYDNNPNSLKGPYKYFHGVLHPNGKDADNNIIYEYRGQFMGNGKNNGK